MTRCPCTPAAVLLLAALASLSTQAATQNLVTATSRASVQTIDGKTLGKVSDLRDEGAGPLALGTGSDDLFGQREVVQGYDGRCVVILTGAPCQGGEDPLTTQTVLNPNKPLTAQEGTSASGSASAHARAGRVGAKASSTVSVGRSHATIDPANPGQSIPGRLMPTGSAGAGASASTRHTNTLLGPAGGLATITLSGVASSHLFIDSTPGLGNTAGLTMVLQGSAAPPGQRCNNLSLGCAASFSFGRWADPGNGGPIVLGDDQRAFDVSFQARPGDTVTLWAYVTVSTSNIGTANASHTLSIDTITLSDGFGFADESAFVRSGNRYVFAAAAVPEPASAALLLAGLMAVAGYARVRRSGLPAC